MILSLVASAWGPGAGRPKRSPASPRRAAKKHPGKALGTVATAHGENEG